MSDWSLKDLQIWDDKICELAKDHGLDWYPITYETCDYFEMLGNMSYHGMPTHYGHWSYGKSFEVQHQKYQSGMTGLPYELIINSNPCISYLMKENPLYLQILIMAHCVGHSDFFKQNRTFSHTRADTVVPRMRNAKKRIQSYIEDPSIGIDKVEKIIDAAHALSYQLPRFPQDIRDIRQERKDWQKSNKGLLNNGDITERRFNALPHEPEYDVLGFISSYARDLKDWEKDIIEIVRDESHYFMPQIRTKVMNEGWACFWHFKLLNELDLPQKYHIPFLKSHNQVVRPHITSINPYHVGFHLFNKIEERYGLEECFVARDVHHDESFLRQYLTQEDCEELNLFSFSENPDMIEVTEVSDENGWKHVKKILLNQIGSNSIPVIYVDFVEDDTLILYHEHDGKRDLELGYAEKVIEHTKHLWKNDVKLITLIEDAPFEI
jgi:stage V sporulation protein R